ncbi:prolyl 4-hydroxylase subunit alpha-3 isoform X1 [Stegostoma tigrinum]|uniref:prolyl 4-hydroxylase subunit alpha-3 isoform X1 n=1 Tax=Stegostoma tigrinum TaxID=3053191 RepID=UPI00287064E2|nr:prolyl 4-hydroxylase subunit alpha-3 isoform X1 [Stegostoma tigrinum]
MLLLLSSLLLDVVSGSSLSPTRGDVYTSLLHIQEEIAVEKVLVQHLQTYIENEMYRMDDLKRFYEKVKGLHSKAYQKPEKAISNPLFAYTLIKRLQTDWQNIVYSNEAIENIQALKDGYEKVEAKLPKAEDLEGAAKGLMRLQDVYSLSTEGLVKGEFLQVAGDDISIIYRPTLSSALSADDCFQIGKVAYDIGDYYHSVIWLEEAVTLFRQSIGIWNTEDQGSLEEALDHLAFSHYMTGNVSYAVTLSKELLQLDSSNRRIARNIQKYEKILRSSSDTEPKGIVLQRPNVTHLLTRDTYESLCQRLGSQPKHYQDSQLYCSYETNFSPHLILQPVKREIISRKPYVVLYHKFVSDSEAKRIKEIAAPWLRRSVVASGEVQTAVEYRISKSAWLKDTVDPVIRKLDQRIAHLTGLNVQQPYAEYLQVVNYGIGGHYEPHFDHATSPNSPLYKLKSGNRVATFMIYLSAVEAGGSTAFIYANFSVPVVKNAALFWWNLHRNGQGNSDTLHAGCPVLIGDKWVANKWIREHGQEFQRKCGADPDE